MILIDIKFAKALGHDEWVDGALAVIFTGGYGNVQHFAHLFKRVPLIGERLVRGVPVVVR